MYPPDRTKVQMHENYTYMYAYIIQLSRWLFHILDKNPW